MTTERPLHIAFFGSSVTSSYWNGAATYYRGLTRALCEQGHRVTFFEPDALGRQEHRDLQSPDWLESVVYAARDAGQASAAVRRAADADAIIKCSGVGVHDEVLDRRVLDLKRAGRVAAYLDVDAPATLSRIRTEPEDPLGGLVPRFDVIFTYGGGEPVVEAYGALGARACIPIYNAVDPGVHRPAPDDARFAGLLGFLGNRLPDREARVREFFLAPAEAMPGSRFVLGGSGWEQPELPSNVRHVGHVYVHEHNAFNSSPMAVLNISRESMAAVGFSPATRVFEAAGAGACLITDAWEGVEQFLEPGVEVLVARNGGEVLEILRGLTPEKAAGIGAAARQRVLREHTYQDRASRMVEALRAAAGGSAERRPSGAPVGAALGTSGDARSSARVEAAS